MRQVWRRPLLNEAAPVEVVVADDGRHVVTLDEWFRLGFGPHVVVLYGHDGTPTRALSLDEFLPANYIAALPHSISSIHWRAAVRSSPDGRSARIPVAVPVGPCGYPGGVGFVDFTLQFDSKCVGAAAIGAVGGRAFRSREIPRRGQRRWMREVRRRSLGSRA